jgi:DNA modification methylase
MDGVNFNLSQGDAVAWLRTLPSESIDLVVTDPPYESLEKHRAIGTTTRLKHSKSSSNDWFSIFPNARFPELFAEVYRVLRRNTHFYLYCDPETMFVAKPLAEQAGFKFWKPIIWDKCLGPETLVWTERGVLPIKHVVTGDRVALPEGGTTPVRATRTTRAAAVRITLSDGVELVASRDHRFLSAAGTLVEAGALRTGDGLCTRPVRLREAPTLKLGERTIELSHALGKVIGLYAAEGFHAAEGVSFGFHANEKHLHATIARFARSLGLRARLRIEDGRAVVSIDAKLMDDLVEHFVGGPVRYFKPAVYAAPSAFRRGVLEGLLDGDGHWSHHEQRETYASSAPDLAMFVRRELESTGHSPGVRAVESEWQVRYDPFQDARVTTVVGVTELGDQELVDVSVADRDELFVLGNGVVTHNCTIGMGYHYRARYECILFFEKGKRKLADLGVADILQAKRINGGYPAEKPPAVSTVLIEQSTVRGEVVIDPFMGSGSVGVAAASAGRAFLGNDLCREAVDITRARLVELGARESTFSMTPVGQVGLGL